MNAAFSDGDDVAFSTAANTAVLKIGDGGDDKRRQIGQKRAKTLEKAKYLAFLRHHRCPRPH